ncbi:hypothetical protein BC941DRAFT_431951 [Chlamydoabsidia padenii]|nr:hypothetical protein BC941DRAFT_431951 [Chlamydoabsidia padenii]
MIMINSLFVFFAFVMGVMACGRPASIECGGKWSALGYYGDCIREALKKIPNTADYRFRIPTSGTSWHQCGRVSTPGRLAQASVQVNTRCNGCGYEAFGDEIHCYAEQALSKCGDSPDFHGQANVCNEYYCVRLTACLDN